MLRPMGLLLVLCLFVVQPASGQSHLQFAEVGDFRVESGEVIKNCRVAYRTFGEPNATKSNVVLFPTWFTGTTEALIPLLGPGRLVDTSKFFVIAVEALGNGISSSPSNSPVQPGSSFPQLTIRDMVRSQYVLLTEFLDIQHLRAVIGISMGGMQTFQWLLSHPEFMDKAVPIVGTPQLAPSDLLLWSTTSQILEAESCSTCAKGGDAEKLGTVGLIHSLTRTTPHRLNAETNRETFSEFFEKSGQSMSKLDANNYLRQAKAMLNHDVSSVFGNDLTKAAAHVRASVLVVVATDDHMVNPEPALRFAKSLGAQTLELCEDCGHLAFQCEMEKVAAGIEDFLKR